MAGIPYQIVHVHVSGTLSVHLNVHYDHTCRKNHCDFQNIYLSNSTCIFTNRHATQVSES